ncbi:unnamed protein product [Ambrosiozyma monospora]|uniref:Unnamed protein product n=1 Tax=Ambrosiozyma monospora TaxID=43982 RepID=A0ACB5TXN2_AMBMO|nr:unnamed protein product [Ambrosiozyma monospora]
MEFEFQDMQDELPFEYNFEKVLDDFILIMYLIGNDFLPNLPDLHIRKGAFALLIETFKEALKRTDGYLNENGTINFKRLGVWLDYLSVFELENFEKGEVDVEWFNQQLDNISRRGTKKRERQGKELIVKQQKKLLGVVREFINPLHSKYYRVKDYQDGTLPIPEKPLPTDFFESELNRAFIGKLFGELPLLLVHSNSMKEHLKLERSLRDIKLVLLWKMKRL